MLGDTFFYAIPGSLDENQLRQIAEKLFEACQRPWTAGGREFYLSVSTGAAIYPEHGLTAKTLMKNANIALSQAKEQGHGYFQIFNSVFSSRMQENIHIEDALRRTLELQSQELFFLFQPRVDLLTGEINSMEALIRWNSSELGLLNPGQFIPIAETSGLIGEIDKWALTTACRQIAEWGSAGHFAKLSVNISAGQFYNKQFISLLYETIENSKIHPSQLELEITETMIMHDFKTAWATISKLKDMGLSIAMDDFGTGYSSLTTIRNLPIDRLKIDQAFIREMESTEKNMVILQSIISLGHMLDVKVTAEGVETEKQLAFLLKYGCDEVQGYYFARPMSALKICRILQNGNERIHSFRESITFGSSSL